jgi:hypothetical protein
MKNIKIISATNKKDINNTKIQKSIKQYECIDNCLGEINSEIYSNNTNSLASIYNIEIEKSNKNEILVFVHDDCIIEDLFLYDKLNEAIKQFDVIGLAGIKSPITIKHPCLWHLMGHPSQYSGAVAHFDKGDNNKRFMTSFGKTPERVVLLDGVFLAINTEEILKKGLRFDENNPAKFHFYDLNFSLDANRLKLKCGTWPIWVTHTSHGLEQPSPEWVKASEYFLQKYNKE